jgi:hypothetical protein
MSNAVRIIENLFIIQFEYRFYPTRQLYLKVGVAAWFTINAPKTTSSKLYYPIDDPCGVRVSKRKSLRALLLRRQHELLYLQALLGLMVMRYLFFDPRISFCHRDFLI